MFSGGAERDQCYEMGKLGFLCVKSARIFFCTSFCGLYFPVFELNVERY